MGTTIAIIVLIAFALGGKKKDEPGGGGGSVTPGGGGTTKPPGGGGTTKPPGGGGTTKPPGGGTTPKPKPPKPDPFLVPGSRKWGTATPPAWFDTKLNHFWISPDCDAVAEGAKFETGKDFAINSVEAPSLAEVLDFDGPGIPRGTNSVYGFLDYLVDYEGFVSAEELALRVMMESNALCADLPPAMWPAALSAWFYDFVQRIEEKMQLGGGWEFE